MGRPNCKLIVPSVFLNESGITRSNRDITLPTMSLGFRDRDSLFHIPNLNVFLYNLDTQSTFIDFLMPFYIYAFVWLLLVVNTFFINLHLLIINFTLKIMIHYFSCLRNAYRIRERAIFSCFKGKMTR